MDLTVSDLVNIIIAVLFPPLAVFIQRGVSLELMANFILTVLFYYPALIHAVFLIIKDREKADKEVSMYEIKGDPPMSSVLRSVDPVSQSFVEGDNSGTQQEYGCIILIDESNNVDPIGFPESWNSGKIRPKIEEVEITPEMERIAETKPIPDEGVVPPEDSVLAKGEKLEEKVLSKEKYRRRKLHIRRRLFHGF
ncbi:uncharacterized protein J8A68_004351 [[Candida] subhashii]|uniref:Plasma membrane proteolipid 3 n=1 Tax=[Candida] subhashii TaxID=561895 RepID=A0A8J5UX12_9ASCO|nr:uncharacterized protein J8A68_004351 [[Candida] subhashii]KAG7662089.1 hypothetical protein J8A68_004351 [[Candida] subhashii]